MQVDADRAAAFQRDAEQTRQAVIQALQDIEIELDTSGEVSVESHKQLIDAHDELGRFLDDYGDAVSDGLQAMGVID